MWSRSVHLLAVGFACRDQRRLTGSGSASEVLHDDALYKSTCFTFFTLQLHSLSAIAELLFFLAAVCCFRSEAWIYQFGDVCYSSDNDTTEGC